MKSYRYILTLAAAAMLTLTAAACKDRKKESLPAQDMYEVIPKVYTHPLEVVTIPDDVCSEIIAYPGFTVSYNAEYHLPNYVSWELTGYEASTNVVGKRQNKFAPDLGVKGCASLDDYRGSGYDRGHMAPAGDMKWDGEVNDASFLLTNMCPQDNALNSGAWNTLENKCRDWAVRDSAIIIICGPILNDHITQYIGQNQVAVPERFFKVILSPYSDPPMGIGFIMPNSKVTGGMRSTVVSIDEVEAVTGFDFFSVLPDEWEDALEAQDDYAPWTRHR